MTAKTATAPSILALALQLEGLLVGTALTAEEKAVLNSLKTRIFVELRNQPEENLDRFGITRPV